jgi:choline kinase
MKSWITVSEEQRLVVVTGHLADQIKDSLGDQAGGLEIEYIFNPSYATTNNIHSLWLARHAINESFLMLESDLVFDESLLPDMLCPNKIAVATIKPWFEIDTLDDLARAEAHLLPSSLQKPATIPSSEAARSTTSSNPRSNPLSETPELLNVTT